MCEKEKISRELRSMARDYAWVPGQGTPAFRPLLLSQRPPTLLWRWGSDHKIFPRKIKGLNPSIAWGERYKILSKQFFLEVLKWYF